MTISRSEWAVIVYACVFAESQPCIKEKFCDVCLSKTACKIIFARKLVNVGVPRLFCVPAYTSAFDSKNFRTITHPALCPKIFNSTHLEENTRLVDNGSFADYISANLEPQVVTNSGRRISPTAVPVFKWHAYVLATMALFTAVITCQCKFIILIFPHHSAHLGSYYFLMGSVALFCFFAVLAGFFGFITIVEAGTDYYDPYEGLDDSDDENRIPFDLDEAIRLLSVRRLDDE